jgi:hypothetical protein
MLKQSKPVGSVRMRFLIGLLTIGEKIMNSGIEVFFTKLNRPWSNANDDDLGEYYVNVYSPDGSVLIGVPVLKKSKSLSIDLPPGRYLVTGTIHGIYVNFDSNETIVNVGCGQRVCVTIIPRSLHFCVWWLRAALTMIAENSKLAPEVADMAKPGIEVLNQIEQLVPEEFRQLPFLPESFESMRKISIKNSD